MPLFQPFTFTNGVTAKNRFFKAAMNEHLAENDSPSQALVQLYDSWAKGGAGVLLTGNVMIDRTALTGDNTVVLEDERDLPMLQQWAAAGTQNGSLLIMQLNHPGKQSPKDLSPEPVAPSAVPLSGAMQAFFNPPRALTEAEIVAIIERFANAAAIAEKAGFSGVQIHAAHGYLLSQFLSPHHNRREDQWGGSLENRLRIVLEIYRAMRQKTSPDFLVGIKLNSADFQKGGFSEEESIQAVKILSQQGIDFIEISGGNYESPAMMGSQKASTQQREAYFLDFAEKVQAISQVPLIITGGFRSQAVMEQALNSQQLDFVGLGKPFAVMPDLPNQIQANRYQTLSLPPRRLGVKKLDRAIGSMIEMSWYMHQMGRIGNGKTPQPNYSPWKIFFQLLWQNGTKAFRKERA